MSAPKTKICPICGAAFTPYNGNQKYCTASCKAAKDNERRQRKRNSEGATMTLSGRHTDAACTDCTYVKIRMERRKRPPVQDGWRGRPCMGGSARKGDATW